MGTIYTWFTIGLDLHIVNNRTGGAVSLDRAFANATWLSLFGHAILFNCFRDSDHSPILLSVVPFKTLVISVGVIIYTQIC